MTKRIVDRKVLGHHPASTRHQGVEATAEHAAVQGPPEHRFAKRGQRHHGIEINPGVQSHGLQQVDPVFRAHIAGETATVFDLGRMPADPPIAQSKWRAPASSAAT